MKKEQRVWKFFTWQTFVLVLVSCLVNALIWVAFHGVPLVGLPDREEVSSVTIIHDSMGEKVIEDVDNVEILVNAANLLNYSFFGETEGQPTITLIYSLKDGREVSVEANNNTMWWHGAAHPIKETDMFVKVIEGLFYL